MKKYLLTVISALILTTGCAGLTEFLAVPQIETSRDYHASYEQVWHAAIAAVGQHGLHVTTLQKDSGFIQTAYKTTDKNHIMNYAAPAGYQYTSCRYMVSVSVMQLDGGNVNVSVTLNAEGYTADEIKNFEAHKNMYWRTMKSFKYMERDILNDIAGKLPASATIKPETKTAAY